MPAVSTIIAGIGLAMSAASAGVSYVGSQQVASAQRKQEDLRKQQMMLDAERARRAQMRKMMLAQATGVNNAAGQGVTGSDSAVQGGLAEATNSGVAGLNSIDQNTSIGNQMYKANGQEAAGKGVIGFGNAMGSWGSGLVQNSGTISTVGQSFGLWNATTGGAH